MFTKKSFLFCVISVFTAIFFFMSLLNFSTMTNASTKIVTTDTTWDTNKILGQNGDYPFAGIYMYDNLTIKDNVKVYTKGISQLVIKVNGTLTLGKNVTICVRNGYYPLVPAKSISSLSAANLNTSGTDGGGFRLYENMFGKGGDGGDGGDGGNGFPSYYNYIVGCGGNGGYGGSGGFGGGLGGEGGIYGAPGPNIGSKVGKPGKAGSKGYNNGEGSLSGGAIELGQDGISADSSDVGGAGGGGGGGNGGRGGKGGNQKTDYGTGCGGGGGGGGGYGGGILTIIAKHIVYDSNNPPKFITSGQVGGAGGKSIGKSGENGSNGQGGLLIINSSDYKYSLNHWKLDKKTYGKHVVPSVNGGHGVVTGNPQKVFINGIEIIKGDEVVIKVDLPTAIENATKILNSKIVGEEEGNVSQKAKDAYNIAIKNASVIRDGQYTQTQIDEARKNLEIATKVFNNAVIKPSKMKIGDYVQFGSYLSKPILWRVINVDVNGAPLLYSENILCLKPFDAAEKKDNSNVYRKSLGSNKWENSNIREWLNSSDTKVTYSTQPPYRDSVYQGYNSYAQEAGFLSDFTDIEKKLIKPMNNKSILNVIDIEEKTGGTELFEWNENISTFVTNYDSAYYKNVTDKVFILDIKELHDYVYSRGFEYVKVPTEEVLKTNKYYDKDNLGYWLRMPVKSPAWVMGVIANGDFGYDTAWLGYDGAKKLSCAGGVVPAIYLKSAIFKSGNGTIDEPYIPAEDSMIQIE